MAQLNVSARAITLNPRQLQVLSQVGSHGVTSRYSHITTLDVVSHFLALGWVVTSCGLAGVRNASKDGFQKHIIRMSHPDFILRQVGDSVPEIVIVNSHDGLNTFQVYAGIFRLICSNGLVVGQSFGGTKLKHVGSDLIERVHVAIEGIKNQLPAIAEQIQAFNGVTLSETQQVDFAQRAATLLDLPDNTTRVDASTLLRARRLGDKGDSLWVTFNKIQENGQGGGVKFETTKTDENGIVTFKTNTTREIKAIDRRVKFNRELWDLSKEYANVA